MRIAIINTVACNGGDAAILAAIVDQLRSRWPASVITAYDSQAHAAARHHTWVAFDAGAYWAAPRSWLRRLRWLAAAALRGRGYARAAARVAHRNDRRRLSRLARADIVISTGGTYLVDTYGLKPRFFEFLSAPLLRRPLILYTQTLGPFRSRFNRFGMRRVLRCASLVFVRDEASRMHARALGARPDRTVVVPDVVFGAATEESVRRLRLAEIPAQPHIAVSVRDLKPFTRAPAAGERYERAIAGLVAYLVRERGARVDFLSTCQGIAEYRFDDARVAARIHDALPADVRSAVRVVAGYHSAVELLARFAEYDAVVATRMHAAIMALSAGTPVLPIPYERKIDELFRDLDARFTIVGAAQASAEALAASWREFEDALPGWREDAAARLAEWRVAARSPAHDIASLLGRH